MAMDIIKKIGLLTVGLLMAATVQAQTDLAVNDVFQKYGKQKGCKMVTLHDGALRGFELKVYKSLTYKSNGKDIDDMLKTDRQQAKKIREVVVDGRVTSGYYMMKPQKEGINRYILFRNDEDDGGAVIYIEGKLGPEQIMQLCKRK